MYVVFIFTRHKHSPFEQMRLQRRQIELSLLLQDIKTYLINATRLL